MRRVLFDEDVPRQLRRDLTEFEIRTVQEQGWSSLQNGALLNRAAKQFAVFVTADTNLQYQQNIQRHEIGIVVIATGDTRLPSIRTVLPELRMRIATVEPRMLVIVPTA